MTFTPEQLARRQKKVCASELAAIAGFSPYQKPIDVWQSKVDPTVPHAKPEDDTPDQKRGRFLEHGCIEWYAGEVGASDVFFPGSLEHPEQPLLLATPDAIATFEDRPNRLVEVKCPRFHRVADWCEGDFPRDVAIPLYYLPQMTAQMAVTGLACNDMAVLLGDELRILPLQFDPSFWEDLRTMAERWWRDHVVAQRPPRPDHTEAYARFLADRHPRVRDRELIVAPPQDIVALAKRLDDANQRLKQAEKEKEQCKNEMKEYIGDYQGIDFGGGGKVTWKVDPDRISVDYQAMLADYGIEPNPGDLARHTRTKPGPRTFRINLKGCNL